LISQSQWEYPKNEEINVNEFIQILQSENLESCFNFSICISVVIIKYGWLGVGIQDILEHTSC
jgi:hypothetical protein